MQSKLNNPTAVTAPNLFNAGSKFPPLEAITSPTVSTPAAAYYLNRQQQTLRCWSSLENGPLRPIRVNGRLAWRTSEIKKLMGVAA